MTPQRWSQIKEVFSTARETREEERSAYLESACGDDRDLRREVELLLAKDNQPSLRRPVENFLDSILSELAPGQSLAQYRVEAKLGEGGMGAVYRAYDTRLRRQVALKVLPPERLADPESKQRLLREARAASALNHPNIVTVHEIGLEGGVDFITMEFVEGKSLKELIPAEGLPLEKALDYAVQIAGGLVKAHAAGIIHRDLKPGNVMVTLDGMVKLLDFGLARRVHQPESESASFTEEGEFAGTPAYMSPEQARGEELDARTDLFSFGCVLYEMVTGRAAFSGATSVLIFDAILHQTPTAPVQSNPHCPAELERTLNKALEKDRDLRYQSAADLRSDLMRLKRDIESERESRVRRADGGARTTLPDGRRDSKPRTMIALAGLTLLLIAGGAIEYHRLHKPAELPMRVVPLTTFLGRQESPRFSPDGKQVAFSWNGEKQDNFDIYVKLLDAGTPLRLTSDPADHFSPIWSPDGRYITFCRGSFSDQDEIRMVPALGGAERKLAESVGCSFDWSVDGKYLALADKNPSSIFLLSVETGEKRKLTSPPTQTRDTGDWSPRFSPDGKTLAFVRYHSFFGNGIYVLPLSSDGRPQSEPRQLTPSKQFIRSFDWTADGRTIVYPSDQTTIANLLAIPASGGAPERLTVADANIRDLAIARSGRRLVYQRDVVHYNIWRIPGPNAADRTSAPSRFLASTEMDLEPQFSPDGAKIVFTSTRSGTNEIWTCDAEGRNPMQLTSFGPDLGSPRWSPDSRWIVFDAFKAGDTDIYVVSADGAPPRRLTDGRSDNWRPSWSRDGRWVYFGSTRSGDHQIWKIPAQGGAAIQVTKTHGGDEALESFDGKFVYYANFQSPGIWKVPVGGGEETRIIDRGGQGIWSVTSRGIYYFDVSKSAGPTLKFYDFATSKMTTFRKFLKDTRIRTDSISVTVSPDGRWILYPQLEQAGSNLMLVENYR